MVDMKAVKRTEHNRPERIKENTYKKVRHRQTYFRMPEANKKTRKTGTRRKGDRLSEPLNGRFPLDPEFYMPVTYHQWDGGERLKRLRLCSKAHYGDKCVVCLHKDSRGKASRASDGRVYLWYNIDRDGDTYERDGVTYFCDPYELLLVEPGVEDINYKTLDSYAEKGYFKNKVFQFRTNNWRMTVPIIVPQEEIDDEYDGGVPPKDERTRRVRKYTFDDLVGHVLMLFDDADFDYFAVDEPDVSDDEEIEAPKKSKTSRKVSRRRSDESDDEEEEDEAPRRKKRVVKDEEDEEDEDPPKKKKRPVADDDEDDEEPKPKKKRPAVENDEDEEPAPRKKRRVEPEDEESSDDEDEEDDETPPKRRRK
jgi:hypothetical protein